MKKSLLLLSLISCSASGGGYVPPNGTLLTQATSIAVGGATSAVPTYNNATLTNQNTIAETNNNLIKTPSTRDPVSTVTGNNYHDETDFVIKGRAGLNYAFTRTYNSAPSSTRTNGSLGYGWVHSYGMTLVSNDYGACPNCAPGTGPGQAPENGNGKTSSVTYTDERGGQHNYLVNETTYAVTLPQGEFDSLAFDSPAAGQLTLTFRNGTRYVFQTVGSGSLKTTPGLTARLLQIADPWGNQLNFTYDSNGRLSNVADNLGISGRTGLSFKYDLSGHLSEIDDWGGRKWLYSVDASGNLASYTDPLGNSRTYGYGGHLLQTVTQPLARNGLPVQTVFSYYRNGRTFSDADGLKDTETLDYDLFRNTTRVTDPNGGIREYEYDSSGRLTKLTEPDGGILSFTNNLDGLRNSKTDALGYATQFSYRSDRTFGTISDTYGNVTREQDALGYTVDTTYGPFDQVLTLTDKRGTVTSTSFFSSTGGCALAGKPDTTTISSLAGVLNVRLTSFCWNPDGTLHSRTDYLNPQDATKTRVTSYTYDAADLDVTQIVVSGSDGTSLRRTFTYDNLGRKTGETLYRRTSPSNAAQIALVTSYAYDALDRATSVTDPSGTNIQTLFDANGKTYQVIGHYVGGATRVLSTRTYDAADRLASETDALNHVTYYAHDAAGNVTSVTDPNGHVTKYEYDAMNRRTAVVDANGYRTTTVYDRAGHVISVTNGNNEMTSYTYDALGRRLSMTDPMGYATQYSYDKNGNLNCTIDANAQAGLQRKNLYGCTTWVVFDELNRPIIVRDAMDGVTTYAYDLLGNVTSILDASGRATSRAYDGLGRLLSETDLLGKTTSYARDEAGNAWQVTNRMNQVTQTTYDAVNRPVRVDYLADSASRFISWDAFGNRASVANAQVGYTYTYDAMNRLLSKLDSRAGKSMSFTYDAAGNILTKTDFQGDMTHYAYDSANNLVGMSNSAYLQAAYQHDGAGRVLARMLSNGAKTVYAYDKDGRIAGLTAYTANGTIMDSVTYARDRVGNILSQSDNGGATAYGYDALYRLTSASYADGSTESFAYDAVGNRTSATLNGVAHAYEYYPASNRLKAVHAGTITGAAEKSFVYDDEGRLVSQGGTGAKTIQWNQVGDAANIAGVDFLYDALGYRIGSSAVGDYYLDGEHLEAVYSGSQPQAKFFRGVGTDELLAGFSYVNGKWTPAVFQQDALMSVTGISSHDGNPVWSADYTAFGDRTIGATGKSGNNLQYTGRDLDSTGLYYYRARYYDPSIGRFISEDPLGFQAGINFYAYVNNNPVNGNDPTGKNPLDIYAVGPATKGIMNVVGTGANVIGQFLLGAVGTPYPHLAIEIAPQNGVRYIAEAEPSGVRIVPMADFMSSNMSRGSSIDRYVSNTTPSAAQIEAGTRFAQGQVGAGYNFSIEFNSTNSFQCAQFCDAVSKAAGLPGINNATNYGLAPLPSEISYSNNYSQAKLDYTVPQNTSIQGSSIGGAAGGFLLYPNKPNMNQLSTVYSKP